MGLAGLRGSGPIVVVGPIWDRVIWGEELQEIGWGSGESGAELAGVGAVGQSRWGGGLGWGWAGAGSAEN